MNTQLARQITVVACALLLSPLQSASAGKPARAEWQELFISAPPPIYPYEARRKRLTGRSVLRVSIDKTGRVTEVKVLSSTGHQMLDQESVATVRRWRARPGSSRVILLPINFELTDAIRGPYIFH